MKHRENGIAISEKKSNDNEEWFEFWISWWGWLL
jgi:hypothetical protein